MMIAWSDVDGLALSVLAFVTAQRLFELVYAHRNELQLKSEGGIEFGADHYPLIVGLHGLWLGGLWLEAIGRSPQPHWLAAFAVLQVLRLWVLHALGPRWTTRIIVRPGAPLVRSGPYRFMSHPNYAVVAAEILVLPLAFGLVAFAMAFFVANAAVLAVRIRVEARALAAAAPAAAGTELEQADG